MRSRTGVTNKGTLLKRTYRFLKCLFTLAAVGVILHNVPSIIFLDDNSDIAWDGGVRLAEVLVEKVDAKLNRNEISQMTEMSLVRDDHRNKDRDKPWQVKEVTGKWKVSSVLDEVHARDELKEAFDNVKTSLKDYVPLRAYKTERVGLIVNMRTESCVGLSEKETFRLNKRNMKQIELFSEKDCFKGNKWKKHRWRVTPGGRIFSEDVKGSCLAGDFEHKKIMLTKDCEDEQSQWDFEDPGMIYWRPSSSHEKPLCMNGDAQRFTPLRVGKLLRLYDCGDFNNRFSIQSNLPPSVPIIAPALNRKLRLGDAGYPRRVAVMIYITKDPEGESGKHHGIIDSAAALAISVKEAESSFEMHLIAMVGLDVVTSIPKLRKIGFRVIQKDIPIKLEEVRNEEVRKRMKNSGCCGAAELLKLWAWTLFEYDRILICDADYHFHQNFDELFTYDKTLLWTRGGLKGSEAFNGGFFVVKPNKRDFDMITDVLLEGDLRGSTGWRGKCCWCYGGHTIQGVLPYYYLYNNTGTAFEVDRCKYNNQVEKRRCKSWRYEDVTGNHFTVCQKPWHCYRGQSDLCTAFADRWWSDSFQALDYWNVTQRHTCVNTRYVSINWDTIPDDDPLYINPMEPKLIDYRSIT